MTDSKLRQPETCAAVANNRRSWAQTPDRGLDDVMQLRWQGSRIVGSESTAVEYDPQRGPETSKPRVTDLKSWVPQLTPSQLSTPRQSATKGEPWGRRSLGTPVRPNRLQWSLVSKVDPTVSWYGHLIHNRYKTIITPLSESTTCKTAAHTSDPFIEERRAHRNTIG